jgi:plasmid stabilization system protein ParE
MANNLVLTPPAQRDLEEAREWYEARSEGLGERFLGNVEDCFRRIQSMPEMHQCVFETYRRALVRTFPYSIFYEFADETVTVYAVFHNSQDPNKWRSRLP